MANAGEFGVEIRSLSAVYKMKRQRVSVLNGLSLEAPRGKVSAVVGPSGAGKTTLMHCMAGLHQPEDGSVRFAIKGGKSFIELHGRKRLSPAERRHVGICFQQSHLWTHMTVEENLIHPQVWLRNVPRSKAIARAQELLESLNLSTHANSQVSNLSGGQRQRVALLRALSLKPDVLLLDEVTASQDPANVQKVFDLINKYVSETECTVITISHDVSFVRRIADFVFLIGEGTVIDWCKNSDLSSGMAGSRLNKFISAFSEMEKEKMHDV